MINPLRALISLLIASILTLSIKDHSDANNLESLQKCLCDPSMRAIEIPVYTTKEQKIPHTTISYDDFHHAEYFGGTIKLFRKVDNSVASTAKIYNTRLTSGMWNRYPDPLSMCTLKTKNYIIPVRNIDSIQVFGKETILEVSGIDEDIVIHNNGNDASIINRYKLGLLHKLKAISGEPCDRLSIEDLHAADLQ